MFQQISGINLITYYAANIYETSIGMSGFMSRILAACNGTEYFLASWIPVFIVEKVGRRPLMLVGAVGMAISMAILAVTTSFKHNDKAGIAAAVFLFVFNTFFAIGWLGMTWLYPAEIVRFLFMIFISFRLLRWTNSIHLRCLSVFVPLPTPWLLLPTGPSTSWWLWSPRLPLALLGTRHISSSLSCKAL